MENAVDNLEAMFQKAEADLKVLSRRLQVECTQGFHNENNPMKLMAKIQDIKSEYSTLVKEVADIQTAQKETVDSIRSMILTMTNMLSQLELQSESPEADDSIQAVYEDLSKLLGVSNLSQADHSLTAAQSSTSGDTQTSVSTVTLGPRASTSEPSLDATEKDKPREPAGKQLSALDRRIQSSDFQEVTQEEFQSVSELVRGKVKLADLNRTYKMLWQHCKEEGHREPLSPKHMNAMGLRVSGATGEAKLKVLRSLKLCQISKTGDVKLA